MRAAVYTSYGPPGVVQVKDIPIPRPEPSELLVKVHFSTVNRTDTGIRSAHYVISRFWSGLWSPKHQVLGCEFAGVVEEIGTQVTEFKIGDRVFGYNDVQFGGHAQYLTIGAQAALARIPDALDFPSAAALTEGAHYALCNLRAAHVQAGQQVLVYGATGAIGSAAVQLLKHFEVFVTAVANTKNVALIKSLGADEVLDYQTQDFTATSRRYDFIFDAVGKSSFGQCKPLLKPHGIYISTELGKYAQNVFYALAGHWYKGKKVLFPLPTMSKKDALFLGQLAEQGQLRPVIDRTYNLEDIVEAHRYVESGQKTGNVLIQISTE